MPLSRPRPQALVRPPASARPAEPSVPHPHDPPPSDYGLRLPPKSAHPSAPSRLHPPAHARPPPASSRPDLSHPPADLLLSAFLNAFDHIIITDAEGTILFANPSASRITGYPLSEIVGSNPRLWKSPNTPKPFQENLWRTIKTEGRVFRGTVENRRKNGDPYWAEVSISPLRDSAGILKGFMGVERDISEQLRANQSLQDHALFMERLIEATPNPVFYKDRQGRYLGCNKAFEELVGIPREKLVGHTATEVLGPTVKPYVSMDDQLMASGGSRSDEVELNISGIAPRPVLMTKVAYPDSTGRVVGLLGILVDLRRVRQAEEALRQSEAKFRGLVASMPEIVLVYRGEEGTILFASEATSRLAGFDPAEVVGRTLLDFIPPAQRQEVSRRFFEFQALGKRTSLEVEILSKNGPPIPVLVETTSTVYEGAPATLMVVSDMREQKRLSDEIARKNAELSALLSSLPDVLFNLSYDGHIIDCRGADDRLVATSSSCIGMALSEAMPPDVAQRVSNGLSLVRSSLSPISFEFSLESGYRVSHFEADMVPTPQNTAIAVIRDVTDRKRAEQALRTSEERHKAQLEEEVRLKTRQLTEANRRLMALERTKNHFLLDLGHELKTPIAVVEMNIELVRGQITPEERQESDQIVRRNLQRLKERVEEVIQLSKFESSSELQFTRFDLAAQVKRLVSDNDDFARLKHARLTFSCDDPPVMVEADMRLLMCAVANLLSNAIKFSQDSGRVDVRLGRLGAQAVISVSDEGVGISEEVERNLFKKYFKGDPAGPGTGVGLYLSMEIARKHNGEVWYEPNAPQGSIFSIAIPLSPPPASGPDSRPNGRDSPAPPSRPPAPAPLLSEPPSSAPASGSGASPPPPAPPPASPAPAPAPRSGTGAPRPSPPVSGGGNAPSQLSSQEVSHG